MEDSRRDIDRQARDQDPFDRLAAFRWIDFADEEVIELGNQTPGILTESFELAKTVACCLIRLDLRFSAQVSVRFTRIAFVTPLSPSVPTIPLGNNLVNRGEIAKLVGVAPINRDSGKKSTGLSLTGCVSKEPVTFHPALQR